MKELEQVLRALVPVDGSSIDNELLLGRLKGAYPDLSDDGFYEVRDRLIEQGVIQHDFVRGGYLHRTQRASVVLAEKALSKPCDQADPLVFESDSAKYDENLEPKWTVLVQSLLPLALPDELNACMKLLQASFRDSLPQGVVQAASILVTLGFEQQARILLVEFLREHHDAPRLYRLLQMRRLFQERQERAKEGTITALSVAEYQTDIQLGTDSDWEWAPSKEDIDAPNVDDSLLRSAALSLQQSIGAYSAEERGANIPGFEELSDHKAWPEVVSVLGGAKNQNEKVLLERVSKLGQTALDLLRYFSDNPGDKAVHAETVLGYPMSEVRRLLLGTLGSYLRKTGSGGWECHPWVVDVLSALDENRN